MTDWNKGRKPDLVYVPFDGIEWETIANSPLYQLVLDARNIRGEPHFEISVPATPYKNEFTPQTLPNTLAHDATIVSI